MLVPNEKTSSKCISCITYTFEGNFSVKLAGKKLNSFLILAGRAENTGAILCPNDTFDDSSSGKMTKL
jgi:hypothetical protein